MIMAQLRMPNDAELQEIRDLWSKLGHGESRVSDDIAVELKHFITYSLRFVGMEAGLLHPRTEEPTIPEPSPVSISAHGAQRIRDTVKMCSLIMSLWDSNPR